MTDLPPELDDTAWDEFGPQPAAPPRAMRRLDAIVWIAIGLAILTAIGLVVLRPTGEARDRSGLSTLGVPSEFYAAEITATFEEPCLGEDQPPCTSVEFTLAEGPDAGSTYNQSFPPSALNPDFDIGATAILSRRTPNGRIAATEQVPCPFDESATCRSLTIDIVNDEAPRTVTYVAGATEPAILLGVGDEAIVEFFPGDVEDVLTATPPDVDVAYQFSGDFQRRPVLLIAALLFAAAVIAVGRWRGVAALVGLTASLGVLLLFVLPAILDGRSPVLVAVVGAAAIAYVTLYLAHGFTRMTTVALIGMVSALVLTAVLSAVTVELARFSGFATEESTLLSIFEGIDVGGILLAGIVLGTAGALDDVTVTQASAVWTIRATDPSQDRPTIFHRAMRIGRDHIASTVNTLLLAYAGAALPLLILFVLSEQSLGAIANSEIVAVEIVRTLVGSIGLVAAVPITTWLAARAVDDSAAHTHPIARP
ncbi:MAG TPA: YibE/F family protein [Acidimicrobiia bacterium]|jgi:uncharacterized membrane protein|nr:YibE/F family protein [Acidimicrobiia bacterium]